MSARAAVRLESLGFSQVLRYKPGKADWFARGLPSEGRLAQVPRAGDVVRRDVPTCRLDERVGEVRHRVQADGWQTCLVVDDDRVILGRLRKAALDADPQATVEAVMEAGPTTIRPNTMLEPIVKRMRERRVGSILVSTPDGQLIGLLYRDDAERRLKAYEQSREAQS